MYSHAGGGVRFEVENRDREAQDCSCFGGCCGRRRACRCATASAVERQRQVWSMRRPRSTMGRSAGSCRPRVPCAHWSPSASAPRSPARSASSRPISTPRCGPATSWPSSTTRHFVARVAQARSDLAAARAMLANQEAALVKAEAVERNAGRLMDRQRTLADKGIAATTTLDNATRDCRGGQGRSRGGQSPSPECQGDDCATRGAGGTGRDRPGAHAHPLADRWHRDRAHGRCRPDRGGEPAGARAVQDRAGSAPYPHRGAGQRGRCRCRR